ncbi:MAG: hypothetical protein ACKVW3_15395, partial [Phycisphaerales bacterium]
MTMRMAGLPQRVKKSVAGDGSYDPPTPDQDRVMYYSAAWQLLEERIDEDGAAGDDRIAQEVWGIRYIDDPILRRQFDPDPGPLEEDTERRHHHLTDAQFSTVAMIGTGADPLLHERVRYDAYGVATHRWAGDLNDDGAVTVTGTGNDLALYFSIGHIGSIGTSTYDVALDLDRNGVIDAKDTDLVGPARTPLPSGDISDRSGLANGAPDNIIGYDGYVHAP